MPTYTYSASSCSCCGVACGSCDPNPPSTLCLDAGDPSNWQIRDPFNSNCGSATCLGYVIGGIYELARDVDLNMAFIGGICKWYDHAALCPGTSFLVESSINIVTGGFVWRAAFTILRNGTSNHQTVPYESAILDWDKCATFPVTLTFTGGIVATPGNPGCVWPGGKWPATVQLITCP